jgi:hypothetical protein
MRPPVASITDPYIDPVVVCANAEAASIQRLKRKRQALLCIFMTVSYFEFMVWLAERLDKGRGNLG